MSYYKILGFKKEPFSTSPDPDFFYLSKEHEAALTNVLIDLRLKRGMSVILGDVGTGKTTLSRKLIQELKDRDDCLFHMVLDPYYENPVEFLSSIARNFGVVPLYQDRIASLVDMRDALERFFFKKTVEENKTIILIVDEAQKLTGECLEVLRVLLNYETNEFKLLQLVLLGQLELQTKIKEIPNFFDRISYKGKLEPLDFEEMKAMVFFRMQQAGYHIEMHLFLEEALGAIYRHTNGYPRRVNMLCHRALKELLLRNKFVVDAELIERLVEEDVKGGWQRTNHHLLQKSSYSS
ncbi:MAG: AAA family ATPase [Candidatus Omnitrophica bacterium]|nr:AAA family ATPase [Candidatus Omnitrophota bacterium]